MAANFGTTLAANGLWREITTWGFRIKNGLFSVNPYVCWSFSLDSYLRRWELLQAGDCQVGNWHVNCQHYSYYYYQIQTSGQSNLTKMPHRRRTWTVKSYCPDGASVHHLLPWAHVARNSNTIESVGLWRCPIMTILLRKWCHNNKHFAELVGRHDGKQLAQIRHQETTSLSPYVEELSSCWDGRPFGHNRHGPKMGRGCCGGLGPHWVPI